MLVFAAGRGVESKLLKCFRINGVWQGRVSRYLLRWAVRSRGASTAVQLVMQHRLKGSLKVAQERGARSGKDVLPRKGSREWLRLKILITKCTERLFTKFRQNDGGRLSSAVWTKCLRYLRGFYGWGGVVGVEVVGVE